MSLERTVSNVFVARTVRAGVAILGLIAFIRFLGPGRFGVYVLFEAVLTLLGLVVNGGINDAVEKRLSETRDGRILPTALCLKMIMLLPIVVLILAFEAHLNSYIGRAWALWLIPAVICRQTGRLSLNALRGELRVTEATVLELLEQLAFVGIGITLIFANYGLLSLLVALLLSWTIIAIIAFARLRTTIGRPSLHLARSLLDFAKYNAVASLLTGSVYNWADTLVIGFFLSSTAVAAYESAWRVSGAVTLLAGAIATTIFPHISEVDSQGQTDTIESVVPRTLFGSIVLVVPSIVGIVILGDAILTVVFGSSVAIAAVALMILMFARLAESTNKVFGRILLAMDHPALVARSTTAFIVLNLLMNVALVPIFGLAGAATATASSMTVFVILNKKYLDYFIDVHVPVTAIIACTFSSLAMGAMLKFLTDAMNIATPAHLLIIILVAVISYAVMLLSLPPARERLVHWW